MDRIFFLLMIFGVICPCFLYLVDETAGCQGCTELEQRLVDSTDKVRILQEEITFLKQLSTSSCHCHDGWIHGNGSCYFMPNKNATWANARNICQQLGGHLACITTAEEEAIVADIISRAHSMPSAYEGVTYVWLGGFDNVKEGHWHWVTGEPFVYSNWRVSSTVSDQEDCLDWSGGWNDNTCTHEYFFLCEM